MGAPDSFRWKLADDDTNGGQLAFFSPEDLGQRHVGTGEFRGYEFLHVNAKRIINTVPAASSMPFRHTINAYRGCSHACVYCFARPLTSTWDSASVRTSSGSWWSRSTPSSG
jgi:hypothetical protein